MQREELFYIQFMDDWIVLAKTRRHLRRAVKMTNQVLSELILAKHPDKTFIALIERGFDFLGYHFSPDRLRVAQSTLNNFFANVSRLYERNLSAPESTDRVENYVKRWCRWVGSAVPTTIQIVLDPGRWYENNTTSSRKYPSLRCT